MYYKTNLVKLSVILDIITSHLFVDVNICKTLCFKSVIKTVLNASTILMIHAYNVFINLYYKIKIANQTAIKDIIA